MHHELRYIRNEKEIALFREQTAGDRMLFHIAKDFERSALLKYKDVIVLTEVDRKIMEDFIGRKDHIYTSPAVVQWVTGWNSLCSGPKRTPDFCGK